MNSLEQDLRHCKARFGASETVALTLILFLEAPSKSQRQKILRTASLVLGAREEILEKTLNKFKEVFDLMTLAAPDGQAIFQNGEFIGGGKDA